MMKKKILLFVVAVLVALIYVFHNEINYGLSLAKGQLSILYQAEDIQDVVDRNELSEEQKRKLLLIAKVKKYAVANLSITDNGNYEQYYNTEGKPSLWVVTGCEPYSFTEKTWYFPFLGNLSYKGFFDYAAAKQEAGKLKSLGLDAGIGKVSGWSTLGWLKDPVLSSMLNKSDGQLVALIIHEMLHGTVYQGSDVDFSENLADFVGSEGAKLFFRKFNLMEDLRDYEAELKAERAMNTYFLEAKTKLEKGYQTLNKDTIALKDFKQKTIRKIYQGIFFKPLPQREKSKYLRSARYLYFEGNDYLMGYNRYGKLQAKFAKEFNHQFKGDLKAMVDYYKAKGQ